MSISNAAADEMTRELTKALERAAKGTRDPERMRNAIIEMNRSREETRQKIGLVKVAVELIRDARNQ